MVTPQLGGEKSRCNSNHNGAQELFLPDQCAVLCQLLHKPGQVTVGTPPSIRSKPSPPLKPHLLNPLPVLLEPLHQLPSLRLLPLPRLEPVEITHPIPLVLFLLPQLLHLLLRLLHPRRSRPPTTCDGDETVFVRHLSLTGKCARAGGFCFGEGGHVGVYGRL